MVNKIKTTKNATTKIATKYETSDGKYFASIEEAKIYENGLREKIALGKVRHLLKLVSYYYEECCYIDVDDIQGIEQFPAKMYRRDYGFREDRATEIKMKRSDKPYFVVKEEAEEVLKLMNQAFQSKKAFAIFPSKLAKQHNPDNDEGDD